jgi:hypothetical protein
MAVPYDKAIQTISNILGGQVDNDVIAMVLESNQGHMERTVEQLLQMTGQTGEQDVQQTASSTTQQPSTSPQGRSTE